ncbi:hypothetical protein [Nonomuraea endophytica]|uniref:hypothetical protein n=1 Tax=Nonomuraea endophytica TaxID=714136 RepID=UPI0037C7C861
MLRAFAPLLRDGGRLIVVASSLGTLYYLAPVLHERFDGLTSLDEVDRQVAAWRDAVKDGSARAGAWPGFVNIPSKIGQVAAVRALAGQRRERDLERGCLSGHDEHPHVGHVVGRLHRAQPGPSRHRPPGPRLGARRTRSVRRAPPRRKSPSLEVAAVLSRR